MQFCMDIHCVMSINPADFIDPLTFPMAPSLSQNSKLSQKTSDIPIGLCSSLCLVLISNVTMQKKDDT